MAYLESSEVPSGKREGPKSFWKENNAAEEKLVEQQGSSKYLAIRHFTKIGLAITPKKRRKTKAE